TGFTLVTRMADVTLILLGSWLIVHYNLQSMARRVAKGEEALPISEAEGTPEDPPGPAPSA
ncbi:MAG TPA: hypothetical protein VEN81_04065, partial [Planctomycetota bacterium]|nr:hypothetical protein [Planctomycetota bacterium]